MAKESSGGPGCISIVLGLMVLGWVLEHIQAVLLVVTGLAGVAALAWVIHEASKRAEARRRCPVCANWVRSVIMTDLEPSDSALLCPRHGDRLRRIATLERELLDP